MKKTETKILKRRSFLKGAALTTVAAGSGALTTSASADHTSEEVTPTQQGYRETKHIKEYYRLARF